VSEFSTLLADAKGGDGQAVALLYERYGSAVAASVRRRLTQPLRRRFDTLDIAHSVFLEVMRELPRFRDLGESAFRRWLHLKVQGKVVSKLRRHLGRKGQRRELRIQILEPDLAGGDSPDGRAAQREEHHRVRGLLDALDPPEQTLIRMRTEQGLAFAEIADRLGLVSAEAARKRYARCLARLRASWTSEGRR
jgi:RNA polymerase sigma factor (sigma-70 family)